MKKQQYERLQFLDGYVIEDELWLDEENVADSSDELFEYMADSEMDNGYTIHPYYGKLMELRGYTIHEEKDIERMSYVQQIIAML